MHCIIATVVALSGSGCGHVAHAELLFAFTYILYERDKTYCRCSEHSQQLRFILAERNTCNYSRYHARDNASTLQSSFPVFAPMPSAVQTLAAHAARTRRAAAHSHQPARSMHAARTRNPTHKTVTRRDKTQDWRDKTYYFRCRD